MKIQKLSYKFDVNEMKKDVEHIKEILFKKNQYCVTGTTPDDDYTVGAGSLVYEWLDNNTRIEKTVKLTENDFKSYIKEYQDMYVKKVFDTLSQNFKIGRLRYMNIKPKSCYSMHVDASKRIHIPVISEYNDCGLIIENEVFYLPPDGSAWLVDTTLRHTAFNGSTSNRIHLVGVILD